MNKKEEHEVVSLSKLKYVEMYESKKKLFMYNFFIGISRGLGSAFGTALFVAIIIFFGSRIQWTPFIGEFVSQILNYMESTTQHGR
jgi:ABC-type Fe3+-siderophore transport system permease subunit